MAIVVCIVRVEHFGDGDGGMFADEAKIFGLLVANAKTCLCSPSIVQRRDLPCPLLGNYFAWGCPRRKHDGLVNKLYRSGRDSGRCQLTMILPESTEWNDRCVRNLMTWVPSVLCKKGCWSPKVYISWSDASVNEKGRRSSKADRQSSACLLAKSQWFMKFQYTLSVLLKASEEELMGLSSIVHSLTIYNSPHLCLLFKYWIQSILNPIRKNTQLRKETAARSKCLNGSSGHGRKSVVTCPRLGKIVTKCDGYFRLMEICSAVSKN